LEEKILRYFVNESPPEEREQVEELLKGNEEARKYLSYLESVWMNYRGKKIEWNVESAWNRFSQTTGIKGSETFDHDNVKGKYIDDKGRRPRHRDSKFTAIYKIAAIIILMVLTPLFVVWQAGLFKQVNEEGIVYRDVVTNKGQFTRITLSDGTRVLLNAVSTVSIPELFVGDVREIRLEGEAFFEVVRDVKRTFRVHAGGALIEVLGTSFNVNTRASENGEVNVVVSEGAVSLKGQEELDEQAITIQKGMMSTWSKEKGTSIPEDVDVENILAWVRGELIFEGTPLREVIIQLERRFNIFINVEDESILSRRLTARYQAETIDEIIKNVALTIDITYRKENDNFYFLK
jgi:transmembrane sensor